jgi:hypothetical protein
MKERESNQKVKHLLDLLINFKICGGFFRMDLMEEKKDNDEMIKRKKKS